LSQIQRVFARGFVRVTFPVDPRPGGNFTAARLFFLFRKICQDEQTLQGGPRMQL